MERNCEYRNCGKDISHKRPQAKFCDRKCKSNESKYVRRSKVLLEKYKQNDMKLVENYKKMIELLKGADKN
jgi:hypothetical protein